MRSLRKVFAELGDGESTVVPWKEFGRERPSGDAFVCLGEKIFHMNPETDGLRVTKTTFAAYEEWKKTLDDGGARIDVRP